MSQRVANCFHAVLHHGWAVVDAVFQRSWAAKLAAECEALEKGGHLAPHTFEFSGVRSGLQTYTHEGRSFVDLDANISQPVAATAPLLAELWSVHVASLVRSIASSFPSLDLADPVQVKLQLTRGSCGCAPCHYDTSVSAPHRQVTLLVYLAEEWPQDGGGELELLPFLQDPVRLSPVFDRGVVFLSDRLLHRSLPPRGTAMNRRRWLLTVWLEGRSVDRLLGARWPPLLQRLVAPALYAGAYRRALEESLPPGEALDVLCESQLEEVRQIEGDEELAEIVGTLHEVIGSKRRRLNAKPTSSSVQSHAKST